LNLFGVKAPDYMDGKAFAIGAAENGQRTGTRSVA
jgi:hypothetical protein